MYYRDCNRFGAALALSGITLVTCGATDAIAAVDPLGPAAINAGPVAITPTAGVELKYRDNVYLQEHNPTNSTIYVARPAVNALLQDRNNTYELDYKGEAGWYQVSKNNDDDDYFDNTFSGKAHVEFTERLIAEGYARWAALHEDRGTGLSEGLIGAFIPEPIKYDQSDVGGSLQIGSDRGVGRLRLGAGYMDREYQNFELLTHPRDRDETTGSATFFYPVAPKTDVLAEYSYKQVHYPNAFPTRSSLDSAENAAMVGVEWEITPNLISTAKAGYVDKDFKEPDRRDWDGVGWSVQLLMQPREQDTVLVQTSRKPEETTLQGNFIKREEVSATWTHLWSDRISTELSGLYGRDTYEQAVNDRKDNVYNGTIRVGYEFRRWANIYTSYSYDKKSSNVGELSYVDNVFRIGVDFSL